MAVPKTTETRCRDGSVQARQDIKRLHKQPHPYIFLFPSNCSVSLAMTILGKSMPCGEKKERCRDGVACVVFLYPVLPVHCHLYT